MTKTVTLLIFIVFTHLALGQTTGPTQPEAAGFAPIGADDMVNLYTGDFNYNIPLMVIPGPDGGYPINMFYNSNVGMDQAASWVGLGWNLNAGAIQRNLRGTPDDFKGDLISKEFYTKPSTTISFDISVPLLSNEIIGADLSIGVNSGFSIYYNNYSGLGINTNTGTTLSFYDDHKNDDGFSAGLGMSFGSQEGFSLSPSLSYDWNNTMVDGEYSEGKHRTLASGATINSKQGFSDLNTSFSSANSRGGRQNYVQKDAINESNSWNTRISFASSAPLSSLKSTRFGTTANFSFKVDPTKIGIVFTKENIGFTGSFSRSWVTGQAKEISAFGAMYIASKNNEKAITDFYRENEGPITKDNVLTPIPVLSYDIFSIQGHGVGGSFRAYQNSIGRLSDAKTKSNSVSVGIGSEYGAGSAFKFGVDLRAAYAGSYSGPWKKHLNRPYYYLHELYDYKFNSKTTSKPLFEPFYFKMIGEASAMDTDIWKEFQTDKPIAFDINLRWDYNILAAKAQAHSGYNRSGNTFEGKENEGRNPRTQNIEYFTKKEIETSYSTPHIVNYNTKKLEKIHYDKGQDHHLNGISVLKSNGVRYNYFLPAYNDSTTKVTFAIPDGRKKSGVKYYYPNGPNGDNPKIIESIAPYINTVLNPPIPGPSYSVLSFAKVNNKAGEDEFYSKEIIPAYAHTFFITSILSQDYVDIDNNGPTSNDLGTYVKFNYEKVSNYKWRFPFKGAYYSKGYLDNLEDDKASYQEGEKDLFYVKSIETKTHVAVFETKDSELVDASKTKHQKELVSITLYSKADPKWVKEFYLNQPTSNWPTPIQTVHLNQDYSLKKGIPNNTLSHMAPALKELYFTYQNSTKGENAKYQFNYGINPDYSDHQQDRWGAYQKDQLRKLPTNNIPDINVNENPYTYQDKNYTNRNDEASAWLLNKITLPSKGTIKVDYEKDDYAYVQDKKATSYIELLGTGDKVYSNSNDIRTQVKADDVYLYFKSPFPLGDKKVNVLKQLEGIEFVRFRVFMELKYPDRLSDVVKDLIKDMAKDYVEGYAEVEKDLSNDLTDLSTVGFIKGTDIGYFKIKSLKPKKYSTYFLNPIRLATFQYIRKSRPDLGVKYDDLENAIPTVFFTKNILSMLDEASTMITGYYKKAQIKGWAAQMSLDKPSYVRLINPERKFGGGARVKSIKLQSDEVGAQSFGQTYAYSLLDGRSSGVAEWEPILGIEENPFTLPIWYNANNNGHKIIFSNEQSFSEEPLGAGLYPSASVGYSRVTVRNLENENVTLAQSGINVSEFYSAKDFPTKANRSGAQFAPYWAPVPIPFIGEQNTRYNGYSMGYSFTLNNAIYGRPKSVATYPYTVDQPNGEPIQKSVYKYKTLANDSKSLDNKVMTLLKEGNKKEVYMGKEIDFYIDEIEANTFSIGLGMQVNLSVQASLPPLVLPSWFPKINTGRKGTRYLTTNKIIYNTPILDSIIQYKDGAKVSTKNLVFDHETGEPIITSVTNEWKQPIFTYNFPAHWSYEQMKGAYRNYRAQLILKQNTANPTYYQLFYKTVLGGGLTPSITTYNPLNTAISSILFEGDIINTSSNGDYYVTEIDIINNQFKLKNRSSANATFLVDEGTILTSGYKNLQSTKKAKVVSLEDPSNFSNLTINKYLDFANNYNNINNITSVDISSPNAYKRQITIKEYSPNICKDSIKPIWTYDDYYVPPYTIPPYVSNGYFNNLNLNFGLVGCELSLIIHNIPDGIDYSSLDVKKFKFILSTYNSALNTIELLYDDSNSPLRNYSYSLELNYFDSCLCEVRKPITILHADATEFSDDWNFNYSELEDQSTDLASSLSDIANNTSIGNPYAFGMNGIWRPKRTSAYLIDRLQSGTNGENLQIDVDGEYKEFYWFDWTKPIDYNEGYNWRWVNEVTKYNVNGASKEGRIRLDIHAASLFGYNNHLVTASASNSKTTDIVFEGFEDYGDLTPIYVNNTPMYKDLNHGNLDIGLKTNNLAGIAHTGNFGLLINNDLIINTSNTKYFKPTKKKYIVSAWVYMGDFTFWGSTVKLKGGQIIVYDSTGNILTVIKPERAKNNIIDGWIKIEGEFEPTNPNSNVTFKLIPDLLDNGERGSVFDDLRIQPFNSGMETYVYDPTNYRLRATLSNQNYATFYNYDEEGNLTQTKVETERGIKTISSNRNNIKK